MRFALLVVLAALPIVLIGCRLPAPAEQTTVPVNVEGFSTPVDAYVPVGTDTSQFSQTMTVLGPAQKGESPIRIDLFSIIPLGELNLDDAIQNAIDQVPGGVAMINVRTHHSQIPLFFVTLHIYHVTGDVVGVSGGAAPMSTDEDEG